MPQIQEHFWTGGLTTLTSANRYIVSANSLSYDATSYPTIEEFLNGIAGDGQIAKAGIMKCNIDLELEGACARLAYGFGGIVIANAALTNVATGTSYSKDPFRALNQLLTTNSAKGFGTHLQARPFEPCPGGQAVSGTALSHSLCRLSLRTFNFKVDDSGRIGISDESKTAGGRTSIFFGVAVGPTSTFGATDLVYRIHQTLSFEVVDQRDNTSLQDKLDSLE